MRTLPLISGPGGLEPTWWASGGGRRDWNRALLLVIQDPLCGRQGPPREARVPRTVVWTDSLAGPAREGPTSYSTPPTVPSLTPPRPFLGGLWP